MQDALILSLDEYSSGVGFVFNGTNGAPSEEMPCEYASTGTGKESELS
jgi:hypothetical protein